MSDFPAGYPARTFDVGTAFGRPRGLLGWRVRPRRSNAPHREKLVRVDLSTWKPSIFAYRLNTGNRDRRVASTTRFGTASLFFFFFVFGVFLFFFFFIFFFFFFFFFFMPLRRRFRIVIDPPGSDSPETGRAAVHPQTTSYRPVRKRGFCQNLSVSNAILGPPGMRSRLSMRMEHTFFWELSVRRAPPLVPHSRRPGFAFGTALYETAVGGLACQR